MAEETRHVGEIYAVNVPGRENWEKLSKNEGKEIVSKYRWIYANASSKDLYEAKDEATKLSNAVGRPLVLVYMPRNIFDGTRNEYPGRFHASMHALIERALADRKELLVTARSYGVHQALRAVRKFDTPMILLIGIAPAFGAFGNAWSDNVKRYIKDVEQTRCKYLMIASKNDGFTWRSGGAAYKKKIGYRGDNDVGRAMKRNKQNVRILVLQGADHAPIDEYLRHGLVNAMQKGAHRWGLDNTPVGDIVYGRPVETGLQGDIRVHRGLTSLESLNYSSRYVRHANWLGYISSIDNSSSTLDKTDATWNIVPGLADLQAISFESKNYPGHYLRHQNARLKLSPQDNTELFKADATFWPKEGLADRDAISLMSFNYPDYYIRHRRGELWLDKQASDNLYKNDATFKVVAPWT